MERRLAVRTGESIAIEFALAGLGSRFLAVVFDLLLQAAIAIGAVLLFALLAAPLAAATASLRLSAELGRALAIASLAILVFMVFFGYFVIFELAWDGRTPGKRALGLRVLRDGGYPVDPIASIVRNAIRSLEFGLGFYAISALVVVFSPANKRIGDYAAGTIVVRDRRTLGLSAIATVSLDGARSRIGALPPAEWDALERYLARRDTLEPQARARIAAALAARVRPLLFASFDHLDDDALLTHVAESAKGTP